MNRLSSNNVVLVEGDELVATAISSSIRKCGVSVSTFKSAEDLIKNAPCQAGDPVIVDMDLGPNQLSGIELIRWIRANNWSNPIILLSAKNSIPQALEGMREVLVDIIVKPPELPRLIAAIQALFAKECRNTVAAPSLITTLESLSKTERAILELLLSGASNKVVASRLDLGLRTAVRYRKALLQAFGYKTIPELAVAFGAAGIGATKVSMPEAYAPSILLQQTNEIRERVVALAKALRDAQGASNDLLRKVLDTAVCELECLAKHPHLNTEQSKE